MTPFENAASLRQFQTALQNHNPLATEIRRATQLTPTQQAEAFQRQLRGGPRCDHGHLLTHYPGYPPCQQPALFLIGAHQPHTVAALCTEHLQQQLESLHHNRWMSIRLIHHPDDPMRHHVSRLQELRRRPHSREIQHAITATLNVITPPSHCPEQPCTSQHSPPPTGATSP